LPIPADLVERLYQRSRASECGVAHDTFADALTASVNKAFAGAHPDAAAVARYLESLHLDDLALACACAAGSEPAWDHFIREFRPVLYRSADAIDPAGGLRDVADALYADLYGLDDRGGRRQSLFRYYHGRSSLATWLRAVLAQRHVDRFRAERRVEPLPEDDALATMLAMATSASAPDPDRDRLAPLVQAALGAAVAALVARDRLRLACYYRQGLTLAEIGRLTGEHEATASRHLTRIRRELRAGIERQLRDECGLTTAEIVQAQGYAMDDAGTLDLDRLLAPDGARKKSAADRSI
jgi:RNA polymerase sigma-70 factor (ECF subfamily)